MMLAHRLGFKEAQRLFRRSPPVRRRVLIAEGWAISQTVVSPCLGGIRDGGSASPCPSLGRHPRRQIGPRPLLVLRSYGGDAVQVQEPGSRVKAPRQSQQPHPRGQGRRAKQQHGTYTRLIMAMLLLSLILVHTFSQWTLNCFDCNVSPICLRWARSPCCLMWSIT